MFTNLLTKSKFASIPPEPPAPFLYEGFETNPGYDYPGWTILADAGSTYDPDQSTSVVSIPEWESLCLAIAGIDTTYKGVALRTTLASPQTEFSFSAQFVFQDLLAIDPGVTALMVTFTDSYTKHFRIGIEYISAEYKIVLTDNSEAKYYSSVISENELYKIELIMDLPGGSWSWKINNIVQDTIPITPTALEITGVQVGVYEDPPFNFNALTYIDEIKVTDLS